MLPSLNTMMALVTAPLGPRTKLLEVSFFLTIFNRLLWAPSHHLEMSCSKLLKVPVEDVSLLDWYSIRVEIQRSVQHGKYGKYRVLFWRLLVGQK